MSNPNSNTPKQTNKATTRGDGSKNTSSDEASFTIVSYQRKSSGTACMAQRSTTPSQETKHKKVTEGNYKSFKDFQAFVYSIVTKIMNKTDSEKYPLLRNWKSVNTRQVNLETATFRTISRILNVKDLHDYCQQLQVIPEFQQHVTLGNAPNGFTDTPQGPWHSTKTDNGGC
jgi:hypothetical protein